MKATQFFAAALAGFAAASPIAPRHLTKREVPQEHSHEIYLSIVREFLNLDNPLGIKDSVFGLLGNGAAAAGVDADINLDCLKQFTADQAFTNAKAIGDVRGMAGALVYHALERNTGSVGLKSVICPETAANPEIAAFSQHQDPASDNAAAENKAIVLELAKQLVLIGVDPLLALESGTFAPGEIGDPTAAGNTCDEADDPIGCIFTQKLLVLDASPEEISSAVEGIEATFTGTGVIEATNIDFEGINVADGGDVGDLVIQTAPNPEETAAADVSKTVTAANGDCTIFVQKGNDKGKAKDKGKDKKKDKKNKDKKNKDKKNKDEGKKNKDKGKDKKPKAAPAATASSCSVVKTTVPAAMAATMTAAAEATEEATSAGGVDVQSFTGTLGDAPPPVISSAGDRPFSVKGDTFVGINAALTRACDVQHNACANAANSGALDGGVAQCETQLAACKAANNLTKRQASALGSCSDATIVFGDGFDGRKEASFKPSNDGDFNHGSALKIGVISSFICQRLQDSCKADAATVDLCNQASTAAQAATQDQTAADTFNSILSGGAVASAEPPAAAAEDEVPEGMVVVEVQQCS